MGLCTRMQTDCTPISALSLGCRRTGASRLAVGADQVGRLDNSTSLESAFQLRVLREYRTAGRPILMDKVPPVTQAASRDSIRILGCQAIISPGRRTEPASPASPYLAAAAPVVRSHATGFESPSAAALRYQLAARAGSGLGPTICHWFRKAGS
jgi:hypothetical protein